MDWIRLKECSDQKIVGENGIVYWQIKDSIVWHQRRNINVADAESFEIHKGSEFIGRDKKYIYYAWSRVMKIDRDTFEMINEHYWADKDFIYCEYETSLKPLKGMDAKSFVYLDNGYAYDNSYAYYYGRPIKSCKNPTTLTVIADDNVPSIYAMDSENVYFDGSSLKNVDVKTWEYVDSFFSRDKKGIYYGSKKLPRTDLESWEHIYGAYSKDKKHVYRLAWIEEDAKPQDWDKSRVVALLEKSKIDI